MSGSTLGGQKGEDAVQEGYEAAIGAFLVPVVGAGAVAGFGALYQKVFQVPVKF